MTVKKRYAILTGDIVNSSKLTISGRKKLLELLTAFFSTYKVKSKNHLALKINFEIYRGDSFQGMLETPTHALRIALLIRTFLQSKIVTNTQILSVDARIAIGLGTINAQAITLAESDGEAFRFSGRLLETLKKSPNKIAQKSSRAKMDEEINLSLILLEGIISKWTTMQSEVIYYKLQGYTEVIIAEILKIKQPAVNQRAKSASWFAVEQLLNRYEILLAS